MDMAYNISVSMRFVNIMVFLFSFLASSYLAFLSYTLLVKSLEELGFLMFLKEVSPAPYLIKTQTCEAAQLFSTLIIIRNVS